MKRRHIQPVSFNLMDSYEKELLEFALSEDKGAFSKYVKRLIGSDYNGVKMNVRENIATPSPQQKASKEDLSNFL